MSRSYSYDLRKKVVDAIELDGMLRCEASQHFNISRNTIHQWLKRKAETGDVQAKSYRPPGHSHRITDWDKFRAFAHQHRDKTQAHMAELWDGPISAQTISRALKHIGFTRKKRPTAIGNETSTSDKRSESSCQA